MRWSERFLAAPTPLTISPLAMLKQGSEVGKRIFEHIVKQHARRSPATFDGALIHIQHGCRFDLRKSVIKQQIDNLAFLFRKGIDRPVELGPLSEAGRIVRE